MTTFNQLMNSESTILEATTTPEPKIKVKQNKKLCECGKAQPIYNYPNMKPAICCSKCKKIGMLNVKDKKCLCGKAIPVYNYESESTPKYCKSCVLPGMIDIMNKNKLCGCDKKVRATFNLPGEKKAICCSNCKSITMVNVIDRKCNCGKAQPTYNLPNSKKAICCKACKTEEMIDLKNTDKLCITCKKFRANFNIEGETKGKYCKGCAPDNTYDATHVKCKGQNGICPLKQRGNPKYKNYCSACYSHNFP